MRNVLQSFALGLAAVAVVLALLQFAPTACGCRRRAARLREWYHRREARAHLKLAAAHERANVTHELAAHHHREQAQTAHWRAERARIQATAPLETSTVRRGQPSTPLPEKQP